MKKAIIEKSGYGRRFVGENNVMLLCYKFTIKYELVSFANGSNVIFLYCNFNVRKLNVNFAAVKTLDFCKL